MKDRLLFLIRRLGERLWVRPLLLGVLSVAAAFVAKFVDGLDFDGRVPDITPESIETLLSITASSMLVIATLAVTSMVSAYASASGSATPRSFSLLVSDDLSQNALSTFLGAFIFAFVGLIALKNGYYDKNGLFVLFVMTGVVVAIVLVTFVRWVDWIARLGRIGTTVEKVEAAGLAAFRRHRLNKRLGGIEVDPDQDRGQPVYGDSIGYVQHVNVEALQACAEAQDLRITLDSVPGTFVAPGRALAYVDAQDGSDGDVDTAPIAAAFDIGDARIFDDDPRFALVALSEIGSRALSPAVDEKPEVRFDRILVPKLSVEEMLEDAFRAIARDGAGIIEVQVRLQKALCAIAALPDDEMAEAAKKLSRAAIKRAESAISHEPDFELVVVAGEWSA